MNKRKWLFVCVAALFSTVAYSQLSFADSSDSSTTQTIDNSLHQAKRTVRRILQKKRQIQI